MLRVFLLHLPYKFIVIFLTLLLALAMLTFAGFGERHDDRAPDYDEWESAYDWEVQFKKAYEGAPVAARSFFFPPPLLPIAQLSELIYDKETEFKQFSGFLTNQSEIRIDNRNNK